MLSYSSSKRDFRFGLGKVKQIKTNKTSFRITIGKRVTKIWIFVKRNNILAKPQEPGALVRIAFSIARLYFHFTKSQNNFNGWILSSDSQSMGSKQGHLKTMRL